MKISIITINYNNLEGLKRTMKSVLTQQCPNYEYIVIDGGSTDGSQNYIEQQSANLTYWTSEKDTGIYNAMNKGIVEANGEYLLFLNSGDYLVNNLVLEKVGRDLDGTHLIYGNLLIADPLCNWIKKYPSKLNFRYFFNESLPHPASFINTALFKIQNTGYDESLIICADWKFFLLAVCKHNATYKHIDLVISAYNLDGVSSRSENQQLIFSEKKKTINHDLSRFHQGIYFYQSFRNNLEAYSNHHYAKLKHFLEQGFH